MLLVHGFLCLFHSNIPFVCDDQAQQSFYMLKHSLVYYPLIIPRDFEKDYILYVFVSLFVVVGVLV
jgi:hypothetical protein